MFVSSLFYWMLLLSQQILRLLYVSVEDLTGEIGMGTAFLFGLLCIACEFNHHFFITFSSLNHSSRGPLVRLQSQEQFPVLALITEKGLHSSAAYPCIKSFS